MADSSELDGRASEEHASASSPFHQGQLSASANTSMNSTLQDQDGNVGGDFVGPSPRKMRSPRRRVTTGTDNHSTDTKSSIVSGDSGGLVVISPKHKDPDRIKKDREREERVRQAREKLEDERKRKLVDLQEQQRQAQENREKQLQMRRRKIEDLRRREVERRAEVEKRRREKENAERPYYCHSLYGSRRETLLIKAEERVARYEAWKRSGQKGGRGHVLGFGSASPRHVCEPYERPRRSASQSALVGRRRSPNGSDSDYSYSFRPQRRALSACSTVRHHCCVVDPNIRTGPPPCGVIPPAKHLSASTGVLYQKRNFSSSSGVLNDSIRPESLLASSATPPTRPKSVVTLSVSSASPGWVRMRDNKAPRKPRPASVGTSMPSFLTLEPPRSATSPRSKSTDRLARERSRPRCPTSVRRSEEKEEKKGGEKGGVKVSRRTLDRLSTPRQVASVMGDKDREPAVSTPKRETTMTRKASPRDKTPKEAPTKGQKSPSPATKALSSATSVTTTATTDDNAADTAVPSVPSSDREASPIPGADEDGGSTAPPPPPLPSQSEHSTPSASAGVEKEKPAAAATGGGDISAEEYKARLAEKRRQAREKAEREAEEERKRQEELQRIEEERIRQEEEEQRRQDEEAMRLAEEARMAEEERLQKAIEAEEARRAEEAARLEQERIAKEEAEKKAKEEAERLEQEKQEKARRDEEERLERKKRLEMIMKRVKTEGPAEGSKDIKSVTSSPSRSINSTASSDTSPTEPDNRTVQAMAAAASDHSRGQSPATLDMPAKPHTPAQSLDEEDRVGNEEEGIAVAAAASADQETAPSNGSEQEKAPEMSEKLGTEDQVESLRMLTPSPVSSVPTSPAHLHTEGGVDKPKFKSPLLQKLVEGKEDAGSPTGGGPRFKSPLLQNLLGKTKARSMGFAQDHSASDPNLSQTFITGSGQGNGEPYASHATSMGDVMSSSMVDMGTGDSSHKEAMNSTEEKDVDTSEDSSSSPSSPSMVKHLVSNGSDSNNGSIIDILPPGHSDKNYSVVHPEPMEISTTPMELSSTVAPALMGGISTSLWSGPQDSGVSFGSDDLHSSAVVPLTQVSMNGHGLNSHLVQSQGLEDSSICMRSATEESSVILSCITDSASGSSVFSSITSLPPGLGPSLPSTAGGDRDFEEFIDLNSVNNKTTATTTTTAATLVLDNSSQDLVNFNKLVPTEGCEGTGVGVGVPPQAPIIAFEDHRQDVPDILS